MNGSTGGSRLQRGQPNSTRSGLEKPSPIVAVTMGADGEVRPRIKMSFSSKQRPPPVAVLGRPNSSDSIGMSLESGVRPGSSSTTPTKRAIGHSDSIASLR